MDTKRTTPCTLLNFWLSYMEYLFYKKTKKRTRLGARKRHHVNKDKKKSLRRRLTHKRK